MPAEGRRDFFWPTAMTDLSDWNILEITLIYNHINKNLHLILEKFYNILFAS